MILWLDDERDPFKRNWISKWCPEYISRPKEIIWVLDFEEFTQWISSNGLPDMIAFDHDLGIIWPEGMTKEEILSTKLTKRPCGSWYREPIKVKKTGMDCAKWLVDYCLDNNCQLPKYVVQSANPAGAENIRGLLSNFLKHQND